MQGTSRYLKISSINFDFIPSRIESPKALWVELKFYPPKDLQTGNIIKLHLNTSKLLHLDVQKLHRSRFYVDSISGKRIILKPAHGSTWSPSQMSGCRTFGTGYDLDESISFLEYSSVSFRTDPIKIPYPHYYPYYH